jgi:alpha-beta hydrolase superfamily lysophospholipase
MSTRRHRFSLMSGAYQATGRSEVRMRSHYTAVNFFSSYRTAKSIFRRRGRFQLVPLAKKSRRGAVPIFLLAARDDELVAPPQLFAVERLVSTPPQHLRKLTADCRHLGLFMSRRVLREIWPDIVDWLISRPAGGAERTRTRTSALSAGVT